MIATTHSINSCPYRESADYLRNHAHIDQKALLWKNEHNKEQIETQPNSNSRRTPHNNQSSIQQRNIEGQQERQQNKISKRDMKTKLHEKP